MTSPARVDLVSRLEEVRLLSSQDPQRLISGAGDIALSNAISRACIVLLSAHLEGYLEDLVTVAMDALVGHSAIVDDLPLLLRTVHMEEHLAPIEGMADRNARAPRIQTMVIDEMPLWTVGNTLQATMLNQATVCKEMNNPGSTEVRKFLELVGVDIEPYLESRSMTGLFRQINSLVGIRNAIAHGNTTSSTTFTDVDRYILSVTEIGDLIDQAVAESVQAICNLPVLPW